MYEAGRFGAVTLLFSDGLLKPGLTRIACGCGASACVRQLLHDVVSRRIVSAQCIAVDTLMVGYLPQKISS